MAALFGSLFAGTPPADLGARDGRLAPCPDTPNCVSSQSADDEHRVAPFPLRGPPLSSMAALARIVAAQPGATIVVQRDDYLYATFASRAHGLRRRRRVRRRRPARRHRRCARPRGSATATWA